MKYVILNLAIAVMLTIGCRSETGTPSPAESASAEKSPSGGAVGAHAHSHASTGPHQGTLIELGNGQYHAELVHDEQVVSVTILDANAEQATPVEASELSINLLHDGKPAQFKLVAQPTASDPAGQSSRFSVQDAVLIEELEHGHADAQLNILIGGKSYRGEVHHAHDAHEHSHAP